MGSTVRSGINIAYTKAGIVLALIFVTLPFSVRAVQPVMAALDREMEDAAATLGAGPLTIARRIVLPNLCRRSSRGSAWRSAARSASSARWS